MFDQEVQDQSSTNEPVTSQFNFQNLWNIEVPKLLEEKFITIEVSEAKLNIKAAPSTKKLATFAKLQISALVWTTKLDKESPINPKWNESKTFQRKTLEKYSKTEERVVGNTIIRMFLPHRPSERNAQPAQDQTPNFILSVYSYSSSSMETLIGETKIPLKNILKKDFQNEWYEIHDKKNQVSGSIRVTFKYDNEERDYSKGSSVDCKLPAESRSQTPTYKNKDFNDQSRTIKPSNFLTPTSLDESQSNLLSIYSNYNTSQDEDEVIQNFSVYQPFNFERSLLERASQDKEPKLLPDDYQLFQKLRQDDIGTTSTNATPIKDQEKTFSSDHLLTTKFTEEDNHSPEKIMYNITVDFADEDLEEPIPRQSPQEKFVEAGEIQETLDTIQKDNIELKHKQEEFASNFSNIKSDFEKLINEKNILSSKMNDLNMREQCLVNEKRNLSKDFSELQQEQENFYNEESQQNELQLMFEDVQREEYEETERTLELEEHVRQIAVFYQRETQNLRSLEQEMYRKLIAKRIKEYNLMSEVEPEGERIAVSITIENNEDQEEDHEKVIRDLQDKQFEIESSIESRIQNIERLQELLKDEIENNSTE